MRRSCMKIREENKDGKKEVKGVVMVMGNMGKMAL